MDYTAWKLYLFGITGSYFSAFGLNTDIFLYIQKYLFVFSPNAVRCGPEKLRIRKLFTQCKAHFLSYNKKRFFRFGLFLDHRFSHTIDPLNQSWLLFLTIKKKKQIQDISAGFSLKSLSNNLRCY